MRIPLKKKFSNLYLTYSSWLELFKKEREIKNNISMKTGTPVISSDFQLF